MCGIAGLSLANGSEIESCCQRMLDVMRHRGPDATGLKQYNNTVFGQNRLSIIDLNETGAQPMVSSCNRYMITFNGEIYNYQHLRKQILDEKEISFRGSSDTEVLLECISHWGLKRSLELANGMFALALLDRETGSIYLARDRFGEKPLYYSANNKQIVFASELRAIEASHVLDLNIDRKAVASQFQLSNVPTPLSIYEEVKKLPAASYAVWVPGQKINIEQYWSANDVVQNCISNRYSDETEAISELENALLESVRLRMISDVPLGAFLSGGVDSSLIVALMQSLSGSPINTFSMGFDVPGYDESEYARTVAEHLGTNHTEHRVTAEDALSVVPELGSIFDEPFSDASQIPMILVSRIAREKVTVCLSGDGGDELFSGYKRYAASPAMWKLMSKIPARDFVGKQIRNIPEPLLNKSLSLFKPIIGQYARPGEVGAKLKRFGEWMKAQSLDELYGFNLGRNINSKNILIDAECDPLKLPDWLDLPESMMLHDIHHYLEGDILTKVDRAAMSASLEGRIPILDPNVFSTAWKLPMGMKSKEGEGKWALKQVLYKYVPKELMERPKMGFGAPVHQWLRGPLKVWALDLLSYDRLESQRLYRPKAVQKILQEHLDGKANHTAILWRVLMFQAWLDANTQRKASL